MRSSAVTVASELERCAKTPPETDADLWWLASAVGYGRLLREEPAIAARLPAAEARLVAVPRSRLEALGRRLGWGKALDDIAASLKEDEPAELEAALESAEELLAASPAFGCDADARAFLHDAADLLSWMPAEFRLILAVANERRKALGDASTLVGTLWAAVTDALTGTVLRQAEGPAVRPEARLTARLLPPEGALDRWIARVAGVASAAPGAWNEWIEKVKSGFQLLEPSPVAGRATDEADWALRGARPPGGAPYRAFVLQEGAPEETERVLDEHPADLWYLERPGERVLIVIVAGERPIEGRNLDEVLRAAADRADVSVGFRVFSRPK